MPAPLRRGELGYVPLRNKFPSIGGVPAGRGGKRVRDLVLGPHYHRGYWLLVISPPPVALRAPPPAGGGGHWCVSHYDDHPAGGGGHWCVSVAVVAPRRTGIFSHFYGKNPQFLLDNLRVRGYSMFTFRVSKERKNTEFCAF